MTEWQPLSVRSGLAEPDGPFEGLPPHLAPHVLEWVSDRLRDGRYQTPQTEQLVALRLRISGSVLAAAAQDAERAFDIIDLMLNLTHGTQHESLRLLLGVGASVWTTTPDGRGLVRRVAEQESTEFERSVVPDDVASNELREAWSNLYGRHPDPSDAWDHTIKAIEALLWPVVAPTNPKATLGTMIKELSAKTAAYSVRLTTTSATTTNVEAFVQMLRLVWVNPDRHATGESHPPTMEEAQNSLQLGLAIVGWLRSGALAAAPADL